MALDPRADPRAWSRVGFRRMGRSCARNRAESRSARTDRSSATSSRSTPARALSPRALYREVRGVLASARSNAVRAVNTAMVQASWHVGRLIVEHGQDGRRRAGYREELIARLAAQLTRDLGRGFDERNLW